MRMFAGGASVIGPFHQADSCPNQDAMLLNGHCGGWVAAGADGLGSRPLSHFGAAAAVKAAGRALIEGHECQKMPEAIHHGWRSLTKDHPPDVLATTCLSIQIDKRGRCQAYQLGDGLLLTRLNGQIHMLTPARMGFANETCALGRQFNVSEWQIHQFQFNDPGDGVILMTDGVSEDLVVERLPDFFEYLYQQLRRRSRRTANIWIREQLQQWPTPGHQDDKTLIGIFVR
ncbi:MAG: protein phosphatase 2C domain-containing protein [Nitrosomonas sp.]|nr:protein phosphatase 2C domain-containing protein [Nitrosomonas sp.]